MATTLGLGTGNNVKFTGASIGAGYAGTAPPTNGMIVEGNLGVGTTAPGVIGGNTIPGKVLQVSGDASTRADLVLAGNAARIDLEDTQGTTGSRVSTLNQDGDMLRIAPSGNTGGMHATNGLTLINASGNVGINTTTPTAALTVNGNVHAGSGVTGADCNFIGNSAGTNASGSSIVGIGTYSLDAGVSGQSIVAAGVSSLSSLTTGGNNTAAGHASGANIVGSSWSVFLGSNAGRYAGDGSTSLTAAEKSIFIGHTTQPAGNSQTNQIVIGHLAIGNGSNTTTIGNSTTVATHLAAGSLVINEMTAPSGVANKVTLYAEDNGSGKTRLMAIFGSGAAQQIAIEP